MPLFACIADGKAAHDCAVVLCPASISWTAPSLDARHNGIMITAQDTNAVVSWRSCERFEVGDF